MYAITANSYRAIATAADIQAGEMAMDIIPATLLEILEGQKVRCQRDAMLSACDWTQLSDAPLDSSAKSAWSVYRMALRNVPAQPGFPSSIQWPISP